MERDASADEPKDPSPLVGEGGARAAQPRGRVRGNAEGLTKRQQLPPVTVFRSRELRRGMGEPERRLRRALREGLAQAKWRSQVQFGPYHADFCSHRERLIVEVDGDEHAAKVKSDAARTRFLEGEGYRVVRFGNADVMTNIDGVLAAIAVSLDEKGRP